jgi:hypothetical protein
VKENVARAKLKQNVVKVNVARAKPKLRPNVAKVNVVRAKPKLRPNVVKVKVKNKVKNVLLIVN